MILLFGVFELTVLVSFRLTLVFGCFSFDFLAGFVALTVTCFL